MELPWWLSRKESPCNSGDISLILGPGISPGEGNGNLLQYFCLGNPMDRGAWWTKDDGVAKESAIAERLQIPENHIVQHLDLPIMEKKKKNLESKVIHRDPHVVSSQFSQSGNMTHVPMYLSTIKLDL